MKKLILILIILNICASANDININFGCYDCNKKEKATLEKESPKYKKESNFKKNIQITGKVRFRFEETNIKK